MDVCGVDFDLTILQVSFGTYTVLYCCYYWLIYFQFEFEEQFWVHNSKLDLAC